MNRSDQHTAPMPMDRCCLRAVHALLLLLWIACQSCLSTARLADFPDGPIELDFKKIADMKKPNNDKGWNFRTGFEYYMKTCDTDEAAVKNALVSALAREGYSIASSDQRKGMVIGYRGMTRNEWNSIASVYYKVEDDGFDLYVLCRITQDITGGWREDRAKKIGDEICSILKFCSQAYPVNTKLRIKRLRHKFEADPSHRK